MKKFSFRYERLLSLAGQQRRQAAISLAQALQAESAAERCLLRALEKRRRAVAGRLARLKRGVGAGLLVAEQAYRSRLNDGIQLAETEVETAQADVQASRSLLQDRHREEKTWDRLRERAVDQHWEEVNRSEQRRLDDLTRAPARN